MGYLNPLLKLPAGKALLALPAEDRRRIELVMRDLRDQANVEAENAWKRRKGPMAAYWRAVSTYARHVAHALASGSRPPEVAANDFCSWTPDTPDACAFCSGEKCRSCGAGMGMHLIAPCEHDSFERHGQP